MKILLVEDTRTAAAVMSARLASLGHEVEHAANGQLAVEKFRESPPDLVLMDIEMPVMNGFEAASRIRAYEATQQWAWVPIIFLTALDNAENLVIAIEAGGDDFLPKSAPETVLAAKMKAMTRIAGLRRQLASANRKLEEMANRDGLTGLCNRRYMDFSTDGAWLQSVQQGTAFGLLMIDVDHFKQYNDCYGHQQGDDCLRAVAAAIAGAVAEDDGRRSGGAAFAARYGGEEFAVVMPAAGVEDCRQLAEAINAAVRALALPHERNASWGQVTVSIGGSHTGKACGEVATLFRRADQCLYLAKSEGRNCVRIG